VPILPLIDLLILMGTGSLLVGFVLKAIAVTTSYRPTLVGFSALDFVIITAICLGMAVVLAARTWVKANEPRIAARRWRDLHAVPDPDGHAHAQAYPEFDVERVSREAIHRAENR
jgi:UDP-N-acetylmuramyl pentapeptide phosphotransferase/UDP-N-acetylglucosamine-1-phosphate transferase